MSLVSIGVTHSLFFISDSIANKPLSFKSTLSNFVHYQLWEFHIRNSLVFCQYFQKQSTIELPSHAFAIEPKHEYILQVAMFIALRAQVMF